RRWPRPPGGPAPNRCRRGAGRPGPGSGPRRYNPCCRAAPARGVDRGSSMILRDRSEEGPDDLLGGGGVSVPGRPDVGVALVHAELDRLAGPAVGPTGGGERALHLLAPVPLAAVGGAQG